MSGGKARSRPRGRGLPGFPWRVWLLWVATVFAVEAIGRSIRVFALLIQVQQRELDPPVAELVTMVQLSNDGSVTLPFVVVAQWLMLRRHYSFRWWRWFAFTGGAYALAWLLIAPVSAAATLLLEPTVGRWLGVGPVMLRLVLVLTFPVLGGLIGFAQAVAVGWRGAAKWRWVLVKAVKGAVVLGLPWEMWLLPGFMYLSLTGNLEAPGPADSLLAAVVSFALREGVVLGGLEAWALGWDLRRRARERVKALAENAQAGDVTVAPAVGAVGLTAELE